MEGYSNHSRGLQDQWTEWDLEVQNYKDFVVKTSVGRYGSFKGFVVLHHLELLTSTEKKKLTMLSHSQSC